MKYVLKLSVVVLLAYANVQGYELAHSGRAARDLSSVINVLLGRACFCKCGVPNFPVGEYRTLALEDISEASSKTNAGEERILDQADIEDDYFHKNFKKIQETQAKFNETDDEEIFTIDESNYFDGISSEQKLLGGENFRENGFPWAVLILIKGRPLAGGAILTDRHIITAATPLQGVVATDVKITAGLHDRCLAENTAWNISVTNIRIHPFYQESDYRHDLAILTLSARIAFNEYVSPICLPQFVSYTDTNQITWISSWLSPFPGQPVARPRCLPKIVRLSTLTNDECMRSDIPPGIWTHDKTCLGPYGGLSLTCAGDVGSPVQILKKNGRFELIGILLSTNLCATTLQGMFTRIDKHLGWIRAFTATGCTCSYI